MRKIAEMENKSFTHCTVRFINLNGGFWGVIDDEGRQWRPLEIPRELQRDGLSVMVRFVVAKEDFSVFMWGQPVQIMEYHLAED